MIRNVTHPRQGKWRLGMTIEGSRAASRPHCALRTTPCCCEALALGSASVPMAREPGTPSGTRSFCRTGRQVHCIDRRQRVDLHRTSFSSPRTCFFITSRMTPRAVSRRRFLNLFQESSASSSMASWIASSPSRPVAVAMARSTFLPLQSRTVRRHVAHADWARFAHSECARPCAQPSSCVS